MQQLEINAREIDNMNEELGLVETNVSNEYEFFQDNLNEKRRTQSEKLATDALKNAKTIEQAREDAEKAAKAAAALAASQKMSDGKKIINNIIEKMAPITPQVISKPSSQPKPDKKKTLNPLEEVLPVTLDELNSFLNDSKGSLNQLDSQQAQVEDDDDDDDQLTSNPMVLHVKDLSSSDDDQKPNVSQNNFLSVNSSNKLLSSSNYSRSSHSDSEGKFREKQNETKSIDASSFTFPPYAQPTLLHLASVLRTNSFW
jgi:hypothetical protein